ncbi:MAG TPA: RluA family pseudouridine synthase [Blastocatellia bacterium]|nr:RluA family pseudouridine synthase [Blastocatellia bacterium]
MSKSKQDGTKPELEVSADEAGERLDKLLAAKLGSRSKAKTALEKGRVFLNDKEASLTDAGYAIKKGDRIRLWLDRPGSAKMTTNRGPHRSGLWIIYEDEDLLVINKPAGLLVHPLDDEEGGSTLVDMVEDYLRPKGKREPRLVHRIDRDTSGLVVFAKNGKTQELLKDQFKQRKPERVYWAVVHGIVKPTEGTWEDWLSENKKSVKQQLARAKDKNAKQAISKYKVLEQFRDAAVLEVRLVTGKRNQIRIQAGSRGYPLVGERQYVYGEAKESSVPDFERQALHALRLVIEHPRSGKALAFEAPLPEDINELLQRLRRDNRR